MNGGDLQIVLQIIVINSEQLHIAHHLGTQELADKALILEVLHGKMQCIHPVAASVIGEPVSVLLSRVLADAAQVGKHGKPQRIGVDPRVVATVVSRLIDHIGVAVQHLHHEAIAQLTLVIEVIEDGVVPEGGPPLVHHLGLLLRIEVLADLAHDTHYLALPGLQQGGIFLDEIENVLLRFGRVASVLHPSSFMLLGQGTPQLVDLSLQIIFPRLLTPFLLCHRDLLGTLVAIHPEVHQGMAGVEQLLHRFDTMLLFTLGDVVLGEQQVVDDGGGIGPRLEQIVVLEEGVVAVAGVGHHQCLHRHGVLLHQVGDAGIRVDDDLVGQSHLAALVVALGMDKALAERPVLIADGHADAGVGIHHLLGGDHLDLVGVGVQLVEAGDPSDLLVIGLQQIEVPVRPIIQWRYTFFSFDHVTSSRRLFLEQLPEYRIDILDLANMLHRKVGELAGH